MKMRNLMLALVLAASLGMSACSGEDYGKTVQQGRCVAAKDDSVTFLVDTNVNPKMKAEFKGAVATFKYPADPKEKGPDPKAGSFISFNADKNEVVVFKDGSMQTVSVEVVNVQKGVDRHNSAVAGKTFPMVNKDKNEVSLYGDKILATVKIPSDLPSDENFWQKGDDVRVFFKEKGQALRFMNISKTNIFKK